MKKLLYLLLLPIIFSCTQNHFYSEFKTVDVKNWKSTDTIHFTTDVDSNTTYLASISVRHQKSYEFSNLWLSVTASFNNEKKSARLEIPLFRNNGKPYGKSSGSLCTQTFPFQQLRFPKKGKYSIDIVQLMRKDPLDGISDIGVTIDKK